MPFNAPQNIPSNTNEFNPEPFANAAMQFSKSLYVPQEQTRLENEAKDKLVESAFQRSQQAAINLENIQTARAEREKAREMLDLEKKKMGIAIEEAKMKGNLSALAIKQMEEQMKAPHSHATEVLDAQETIAEHKEHQHRQELEQSVGLLTSIAKQVSPQNQSPTLGAQVRAFGDQPSALNQNMLAPQRPPIIPQDGAVRQGKIPRYEIDMSKAIQGEPALAESSLWKKQEEAKLKQDFSINALKIDENDKALLEQVYNARKSGQQIDKAEILSQLTPETAVSLQGLIDYEDDPRMYSSRNNSRKEAVMLARMVDPTYDPTKYETRKKYRLELASESSVIGKQKRNLNTVAQHVAQLDGYIDLLGGGNIKPTNMVVNFAKEMTGNPNLATYEQASEAVLSEMQSLLTGVGVTQEGMREARKIVSRDTGYEAKKAALASLVKIIHGRTSVLRHTFENNMGKEESGEILYPESKEIFDKYLTSSVKVPSGRIPVIGQDGRKFTVPENQLEEAIAAGYQRI